MQDNALYYGDCLDWMRQWPDESFDLIYLDPPFNSNEDYNVIIRKGNGIPAQMRAFSDTWKWDSAAAKRVKQIKKSLAHPLHNTTKGLRKLLGDSPMLAYLTYMGERFSEFHRLLKSSGSLYLHCDDNASHYLKIVLDTIFEIENFRNEITWRRLLGGKSDAKQYGRSSDKLLFYTKSGDFHFTPPRLTKHDPRVIENWYNKTDARGRYASRPLTAAGGTRGDSGQPWRGINPTGHWTVPRILQRRFEQQTEIKLIGTVRERLDQLANDGFIDFSSSGLPSWRRYLDEANLPRVHDMWFDDDVKPLGRGRERLGFNTQKPIALLERIIRASSRENDIVLDPFCGSGTTIEAAQRLGRRWVGIDLSATAVEITQEKRLNPLGIKAEFYGMPRDLVSARKLAADKPLDFETWAVTRIRGMLPNDKQIGDAGVDGRGLLHTNLDEHPSQLVIVQVKAGKTFQLGQFRDFLHVIRRDNAAFGIYITMDTVKSTRAHAEATALGEIPVGSSHFPRVQLWSIQDYFSDRLPNLPPLSDPYTGEQILPKLA